MGTEIATREQPSSGLVTRAYLDERRALIRELYAPEATDLEFEHFLETAAIRGLNPLAKQVYAVSRWDSKKRKNVMTIQTGIDGYRLVAQRTGEYAGQLGPQWCGRDGEWREVWLASEPPAAARVGVMRKGFTAPLWGVARWSSYVQTNKDGDPSRFWAQMPDVMLAKVAEALALRKAFPEELSGLYTAEEMAQAGKEPAEPASGAERFRALRSAGLTDAEIVERLRAAGINGSAELADDAAWQRAQEAVSIHDDEPIEGEVVEHEEPAEPTLPGTEAPSSHPMDPEDA